MPKIKKFVLGSLETNCYIIWNEISLEAVIIDPAVPFEIDKNLKVKYIINTHGHADHILGNNYFKDLFPTAKLVIHQNDADFLLDNNKNLSVFFGQNVTSYPSDLFVKEGDVLIFGEHQLKIIETPGHTMGSICLILDEVAIFTGDTLFCGSIGRTDFPHASSKAMMASLEKLKGLAENLKVYAGHGPDTTIGFEVKTNPFLG